MRTDRRIAITEHVVNGGIAAPGRTLQRWEYRSELMDRDADLAQFGVEGWECFAVIAAAADMAMFYFRRPR